MTLLFIKEFYNNKSITNLYFYNSNMDKMKSHSIKESIKSNVY
ncbi:hypothetical protein LSO9J_190004 [Candidatus Liberibacter solanacearum]